MAGFLIVLSYPAVQLPDGLGMVYMAVHHDYAVMVKASSSDVEDYLMVQQWTKGAPNRWQQMPCVRQL